MPAKKKAASSRAPQRYRILSLDGGGIRGVITAVWLEELEERLGGPIREHFDLVAGTSTGAILACALSKGMSATEVLESYRSFGREVFPTKAGRLWNRTMRTFTQGPSAPKYDDRGLERALKRQFGEMKFGQLLLPTIVTSYDVLTRQAVVMKTMGAAAETPGRFDELPVWEVVKASSSAPTYFPAHVMQIKGARVPLVDGGVVANNPTACALAEGVKINGKLPAGQGVALSSFVVVSLGTGQATRSISVSEAREWGAIEWAIPIIDVLFDGAGDATDYIVRQLVPDDRYFRLQTALTDAFDDMDDASQTNVNALERIARSYIENQGGGQKLDELAALIK
jgi:predicted acylesterase/phospholipase RssA